jgi:hypothetical protein
MIRVERPPRGCILLRSPKSQEYYIYQASNTNASRSAGTLEVMKLTCKPTLDRVSLLQLFECKDSGYGLEVCLDVAAEYASLECLDVFRCASSWRFGMMMCPRYAST